VIPDGVKHIAYGAFEYCTSLKSITIPESVTVIDSCAFKGCTNLTSINIPDTVTRIGNCAFDNTYYFNDNSNWKNGVLYIGNYLIKAKESLFGKYAIEPGTLRLAEYAFEGCIDLTDVDIPDSITSIEVYAFYRCNNLMSVTIPNSVTSVGLGAFENCTSLKSITIPKNVKKIGRNAFKGCTKLASIIISDSVTEIGINAFDNTEYYKNDSNWKNGVLYIGNYLIKAKESLSGKYAIEPGTLILAGYAFENCIELTDIIIPGTVTAIVFGAFKGCTKLTSLNIPENVSSIGDNAFDGCTNLTSVTIPDSIISFGKSVFNQCKQLNSVNITNLESWCKICFPNPSANPVNSAKQVFLNNELITDLIVPSGITSINDYAFHRCECLKSVTIPGSVNSIGACSFAYCKNLVNVTISAKVKNISEDAFKNCKKLPSLTILDDSSDTEDFVNEADSSPVDSDNPYKDRKIVFIGITTSELKQKMEAIGISVLSTVNNTIDFAVYSRQMVGPSEAFRKALYQNERNGKQLLDYGTFVSKLKECGVDISDIENADIVYKTDTREEQIASMKKAIEDNIFFLKHEDILNFNDDCYEIEHSQSSGKMLDFDYDVLEVLEKYDTQAILGIDAEIDSIISAFGGYKCIENIIATCIATRMFVDPDFDCSFRIYRDKWEERGDYGMMYGSNDIPPAIYWEINKRHPFGYCSYK
ncbi:MAG: leucine-rich repeat domain-containing protein, partial [Clostridia bacterium]|nr:leucine-rich repeat domain-containing protein [Clostridia bacterium]